MKKLKEPGPQQSMKTEDTSIKNEGTTPEHLGNKVFVGGLPLHVDKDALHDFFSCFGPVTDVSCIHRVFVFCLPSKLITCSINSQLFLCDR